MSFDDYANHIYQKHRLAVSLAVIRSKPSNVDTAKYLEELKSKFQDKMEDDDFTVCSDDFLIDDDDFDMNDSVTILKDLDLKHFGNEGINDLKDVENVVTHSKNAALPGDLSQTTYYDGSQTQNTPNFANYSNYQNVLNYNDHNLNHNLDVETSIPTNMLNKNVESNDKITIGRISNMNTVEAKTTVTESNSNLTNTNSTYYDSQKTILYTVHGYTDKYTHFSPSQSDIVIPNKYIYSKNKTDIVQNNDHKGSSINTETEVNSKNINVLSNETVNVNRESTSSNILNCKTNEIPPANNEIEYSQTLNMFTQRNDVNFNEIQNVTNEHTSTNILNYKTSATPPVNIEVEYNQTLNMFSQRNDVRFNEIQAFTHTNINKDTMRDNTNTILDNKNNNQPDYSQNVHEYFEEIQFVEQNNLRNTNNINNEFGYDSELTEINITDTVKENNQNTEQFSQNIDTSGRENEFEISMKNLEPNQPKDFQNQNTVMNTQNSENNHLLTTLSDKIDINDKTEEYEMAEDESESQEIISYKVVEEFNKVNNFLNKPNRRMSCDGYSTDSGYKSDSQIRSSNRSALQLSGNWLNQSGCCLFNYIMHCPLVASTRDITNEIAKVLSQLIDRLHEEEKYPSFLEDLIETVDVLLRHIHDGATSGDSDFLKKDESIQRILLLSKSIHIQKLIIEKITNILETFHSNITQTDSTYELSNIEQMENISYIFHILEILLRKYLKNKHVFSQSSTQPSQDEEKIFKKSSITDIWRKKWNPTQKVVEGSREKKCVLKTCSNILNKIVVDCVKNYSLIAYSALKCFNSMQS